MKPFIYLLVLLSFSLQLPAQSTAPAANGRTPAAVQPLAIGDTLPALTLQNVINHPTGNIRLEDYRGRWLVLDFWATWCAPCIGMFPKTDSLEHLFEGKLSFLPVTYEGAGVVKAAFAKRKLLQGLNPAIVTADNTLRFLFPHESLPHYVWIDPQGVVRAMTSLNEINAENIHRLLKEEGTAAQLRQARLQSLPFGRYDKLAQLNPLLPESAALYSSTLTGYIDGMKGFYAFEQADSLQPGRIISTNSPLSVLYREAFSTVEDYYGANRTLYAVAEPERFEAPGSGEIYEDWLREGNGFCYELQVPPKLAGQERALMQQDLNRLFPHYRAGIEEREWPVLALVRTGRKNRLKSRGGEPKVEIGPYGAKLENIPLRPLIRMLNIKYMQDLPGPVVDLTGHEGPVDLQLEADLTDVESLRKALKPYGLELVEKKARIKVLVVRDGAGIN